MKYKEWLTLWLENYVKPAAKPKTYTRYNEIVHRHLIDELGETEVKKITPLILQKYVTELLSSGNKKTAEGLSASTVNIMITVIQNSLLTAYNLSYIEREVAGKIKRPKAKEKRVNSFTIAEQKLIEEEILRRKKTKMYGILLCLYMGLRIGELLALEWTDIDFIKKELSISEQIQTEISDNAKCKAFVEQNLERKKTNAIKRRIRLWRKVYTQGKWDYFVTFTFDSKKHTPESFEKTLRNTLKHAVQRKGWK